MHFITFRSAVSNIVLVCDCLCIFFFISDAFSNTWELADWILSYPPQWLQSQGDANNCGVFMCTVRLKTVINIFFIFVVPNFSASF